MENEPPFWVRKTPWVNIFPAFDRDLEPLQNVRFLPFLNISVQKFSQLIVSRFLYISSKIFVYAQFPVEPESNPAMGRTNLILKF